MNCWHFKIYEHDHFMLSCAEHEKSFIISEPYVSDGKLILPVKI